MAGDISENLETVCVQVYKFQTGILRAKERNVESGTESCVPDLAVLPDVYFAIIVYKLVR